MSQLYAVIGNPIKHSLSPVIHREFAAQNNKKILYNTLLAKSDTFTDAVRNFFAVNGLGLNITLPFKQQAYSLSSVLSQRAQEAQAVNTLFYENQQLYGDNTDGIGLARDLIRQSVNLIGKKILVIGAGGAARGIIASLLHSCPNMLVVANRTREKASTLERRFKYLGEIVSRDFNKLSEGFDLVINATASDKNDFSYLPDNLVQGAICYDLCYNLKTATTFNLWAEQHGAAQTIDGIGMLVEQAAEAFYLWHGARVDTQTVLDKLLATKDSNNAP
jgi:shikimate dehydrogenase